MRGWGSKKTRDATLLTKPDRPSLRVENADKIHSETVSRVLFDELNERVRSGAGGNLSL